MGGYLKSMTLFFPVRQPVLGTQSPGSPLSDPHASCGLQERDLAEPSVQFIWCMRLKFTQCSLLKYSSPLNDHRIYTTSWSLLMTNDHPASLGEYSSAPIVSTWPGSLGRENASFTFIGTVTRQRKNFRVDHCSTYEWAPCWLSRVQMSVSTSIHQTWRPRSSL